MYDIAKSWEERFGAEIIDISHDTIDFRLTREISEEEIVLLIRECRNHHADANCTGGYEELRKIIKDKSEFYIWWD